MKVKKIPQRTCTGCKTVRPKKELVRIVRTPDGDVLVDPTGKKSGRGAYICPNPDCLELAFKKAVLDQALETTISAADKERLGQEILKLIK
ncbi:MAG TPA: YlxR family protein [Bacillota bacterium]